MSNEYYDYSGTFIAGGLARAEEVAGEFVSLQVGFDLLPTPEPDGSGFAESFTVPNPTLDAHVANWGTLKALEASSLAANTSALAAEDNIVNTVQPDINSKHTQIQGWHSDVDTWRTDTSNYRTQAQDAAQQAILATSGARTWQEGWDASGGTLPIPTPVAGDEGKYWRIVVGGTLPQVGAVIVEDELSIKADLSYEVLPANLSVTSVAGKTGAVTVTKGDVGLSNVQNNEASDSLALDSSIHYATSKAAFDLKGLVDSAQVDATQALADAAAAQSDASVALGFNVTNSQLANDAQTDATQALADAAAAQSTADGAVTVNTTQGSQIAQLLSMLETDGSHTWITLPNGTRAGRFDENGNLYLIGQIYWNEGSV